MAQTTTDAGDLKNSEVADRKGVSLERMASQMADKMASSGEQSDRVIGIKKGDTLSALAKKYGTTVKALMASNPDIKDANKIRAGAKLNIAQKGKSPAPDEETPPKKERRDVEPSYLETGMPEEPSAYKSGGSLRRASGGGLGVGKALRGYGAVRKK